MRGAYDLIRRRLDLRGEDGFTLIEMLVAATLLAIGIGATITVLNASGRSGGVAERQQSGVALAQQEIESIRALPYEQVGMSSVTWPVASGPSDDPSTRIVGGRMVPLGGTGQENVVGTAACPAPSLPCQVAPYSTRTLGSGASAVTAQIYRFVSWRDEECPLGLDLTGQSGLLAGLIGSGGLAATMRNLLTNLGGTNGSLQALINSIELAGNNLNGLKTLLGSLIGLLTGTVNGILNIGQRLDPLIDGVLGSLQPLVGAAALTGILDRVANLTALDLCDMDLSAIKKLNTLKGLLGDLQPTLSGLNGGLPGVITEFNKAASASCGVLGALGCILNGILGPILNPVLNTLNAILPLPTGVETLLNRLRPGGASYGTLQDLIGLTGTLGVALDGLTQNTDENTKRVQVAVILDPAGPTGPQEPIWMSTIVTDPKSGLLMP
jgi:prepilin-type N-terminal cleavage/methylation domain-containing protein